MPRYIETVRGVVSPWQCDRVGHMNVQYYMAAISDAAFQLMVHIGLGADVARTPPVALAAVRIEFDFAEELRSGDAYVVSTTIEAVGTKSLTLRHRMQKVGTDALLMEARAVAVCIDLESRAACPLPTDVTAKARAIMESVEGRMPAA